MKPRLRLAFVDMGPPTDPAVRYFLDLLGPHYEIELSENPDFLFYSRFTTRYLQYDCTRINYIGEPRSPNFFECDYALSFDFPHLGHGGRNYRLPHYAVYADPAILERPPEYDPEAVLAGKTRFCNLVHGRSGLPGHERRVRFFERLSRYKRVDSGGRLLNNIGGAVADKLAFIRDYKFTIAFENSARPGYVSEKIFDPLLVGSVPIYWGHAWVERDFAPGCFVDAGRFRKLDDLVDYIVALDTDDELYLELLRTPPLPGNRAEPSIRPAAVLQWLQGIFQQPGRVRKRRRVMAYATHAARKVAREAGYRLDALSRRLGREL